MDDCWDGGNRERQCYTPQQANLEVGEGLLRLTALLQSHDGPSRPGDSQRVRRAYTSAMVHTRGKAGWRTGRIEVRARLPDGQGLWPAIWLLPEAHERGYSAPAGEIDVMEAVSLGPGGRRFHATLHLPSAPARTASTPVSEGFHVYALEWTQRELIWRLDGRVFHRAPARHGALQTRYFLILNLAVGGTWPERAGRGGVDSGALPASLEVDWVRVYAR